MAMPHVCMQFPYPSAEIMKLSNFSFIRPIIYRLHLGGLSNMPRRQELTHLTASELDQLKDSSAVVKNQHFMYYS